MPKNVNHLQNLREDLGKVRNRINSDHRHSPSTSPENTSPRPRSRSPSLRPAVPEPSLRGPCVSVQPPRKTATVYVYRGQEDNEFAVEEDELGQLFLDELQPENDGFHLYPDGGWSVDEHCSAPFINARGAWDMWAAVSYVNDR